MTPTTACALLLAACAVAAEEKWKYENDVAVLTPDNFEFFINQQEYTLIEFYAPWCGHCKSLEPEWAAASKKTRKLNPPTILAKVDADQHKDLAEKYGVSGYPTIKVFKGGRDTEYEGPRDAKGIVSFVKKAVGAGGASSLMKLQVADDEVKLVAETGYALIGLFREPVKASAMFSVFSEVATDLGSYFKKPVKAAYSARRA